MRFVGKYHSVMQLERRGDNFIPTINVLISVVIFLRLRKKLCLI